MNLREWLTDQEITFTKFAELVGCTRPAVSWWAMGRSRPSPLFVDEIKKLTRGQVTAEDHQRVYLEARR
tara:strand:+ start:669 stop:875 length:207 start_codon:yes stop_codon:yes gene_type:complete